MNEGSFVQRQLRVSITLRAGSFGDKGNTIVIEKLPVKAKIEKTGPPDMNKATVEIAGLAYEKMEQLTTLGFKPLTYARNIISVEAGNERDGYHLAFRGDITSASADFNAAPDIWFKMEARTGFFGATTAKGPTTIKGNQPVGTLVEKHAKEMGYAFRNDGVDTQINNSVFNGSPLEQSRAAAREVGAELLIDDDTVILSPRGGKQGKGKMFKLAKDTGLLGYPVITNTGLDVKALYNPAFRLGGFVEVASIVPKASGIWRITKLSHDLAAFCPTGGPWESALTTSYLWRM